jgi:hypothetical protein
MATFTKKRGAVGWPRPQARQIEGWCNRYGIDVDLRIAQTGTIYLTLSDEEGNEITVRCADHADCYATADYTVDPATDMRAAVKAWIETHGDDSAYKARIAINREYTRLAKSGAAGTHALMPDGEQWYPWNCNQALQYTDLDVERIKHQIKHGYAADRLSADWRGLAD